MEPLYIQVGTQEGAYDAACGLVKQHHYSHRVPANIRFVATWHKAGGLFGNFGPPVAAIIFSSGGARWSQPVLELTRLVRTDECEIPLTGLIAASVNELKALCHPPPEKRVKDQVLPDYDLLVSFADAAQSHHGGIYQAASWSYAGKRDRRLDGVIVDGRYYPGRSANATFGTQSITKLREMYPDVAVEPHYDEGKHLYFRTLGSRGARKAKLLGLTHQAYPKAP